MTKKKSKKSDYHKPESFAEAVENPRYQGKIVISAGGEVQGTYSEDRVDKILKKLSNKYPGEELEIGYVQAKDQVIVPNVVKLNKKKSQASQKKEAKKVNKKQMKSQRD